MSTLSDQTADSPKTNWPLICGGIAAVVLGAGLVAAVIAMYVANFNLLEWLE